MAIITKTTTTYKQLLSYANKLRRESLKDLKNKLKPEILELMQDGISPTQGGEWYPEYSERYKRGILSGKYKKSISPVNLKLTGKLHRSLKVKTNVKSGTITLKFTDDKAAKHDKGLGVLPVRQLLPNSGQRFHANIRLLIDRTVKNFAIRLAKKASDR